MSSTNTGYYISVLNELSTLGIYAEDLTLPEEKEIYDVDKTKIPSAADIAIMAIVWTAAPSIHPFQLSFIIANGGSRQPLILPYFNHFFLHERVIRGSPYPSHYFELS